MYYVFLSTIYGVTKLGSPLPKEQHHNTNDSTNRNVFKNGSMILINNNTKENNVMINIAYLIFETTIVISYFSIYNNGFNYFELNKKKKHLADLVRI